MNIVRNTDAAVDCFLRRKKSERNQRLCVRFRDALLAPRWDGMHANCNPYGLWSQMDVIKILFLALREAKKELQLQLAPGEGK